MHHTALFSMALLVALTGCGTKVTSTATPPKAAAVSCTLDVCGVRRIPNPTESDIRREVDALDAKKGDAFLILGPTDMT